MIVTVVKNITSWPNLKREARNTFIMLYGWRRVNFTSKGFTTRVFLWLAINIRHENSLLVN